MHKYQWICSAHSLSHTMLLLTCYSNMRLVFFESPQTCGDCYSNMRLVSFEHCRTYASSSLNRYMPLNGPSSTVYHLPQFDSVPSGTEIDWHRLWTEGWDGVGCGELESPAAEIALATLVRFADTLVPSSRSSFRFLACISGMMVSSNLVFSVIGTEHRSELCLVRSCLSLAQIISHKKYDLR